MSRALEEAGFIPVQMDEHVRIWAEEGPAPTGGKPQVAQMLRDHMAGYKERHTTWTTRKIHVIQGVHVGDLIGCGSTKFQKATAWLTTEFELGAKFTF